MASHRTPAKPGKSTRGVDATEIALLTTVLELTVVVAQTGMRVVPPFDAPVALRPFLQFTSKVPGPALRAARRVLDEDALFRARVAVVATEELVGPAGSLYVKRPADWEFDFRQLVTEAMAEESREGAASHVVRLERKLAGVEASLEKTEIDLVRLRTEFTAVSVTLAQERKLHALVAGELEALRAASQRQQVSRAQEIVMSKKFETTVQLMRNERDAAVRRARLAEEALRERDSFDVAVGEALSALDGLRGEFRAVQMGRAASDARPEGSAESFSQVLGNAQLVGHSDNVESKTKKRERSEIRGADRSSVVPAATKRLRVSRRNAIPLPPGVFDDTVDAASWLFRTTNVMVLVDGYNVAKWRWPQAGPFDLRSRLLAMSGQISQRTGALLHLVFDGVQEGGDVKPGGSAKVRVSFSAAGIEADDLILDMAAKAPPTLPIVIVSNDMRVVDGALTLGVNVVPVHAFVGLSGSTGLSGGASLS